LFYVGDGLAPTAFAGDIELDEHGFVANGFCQFYTLRLAACGNDDVRAFVGEVMYHCFSEGAYGAGNNDCAVSKSL
jgi:hypothetical protein